MRMQEKKNKQKWHHLKHNKYILRRTKRVRLNEIIRALIDFARNIHNNLIWQLTHYQPCPNELSSSSRISVNDAWARQHKTWSTQYWSATLDQTKRKWKIIHICVNGKPGWRRWSTVRISRHGNELVSDNDDEDDVQKVFINNKWVSSSNSHTRWSHKQIP